MQPKGVSLIELMIAAVITVMLLGIVVYGIQSAAGSTRMIQTQQLLTEDLRSSGNLISDELGQAYHIYPPGAELTLESSSTYTVTNFNTGSNVWKVGEDPIIAAILPPEDPEQKCTVARQGCLRFVAYYPLLRSTVVGSTNGTPEFIGDDPQNASSWTVFRYITYLTDLNDKTFFRASNLLKVSSRSFEGSRGELLADYIRPSFGFQVDWASATGSKCLIEDPLDNTKKIRGTCPASGHLDSAIELVFQLRGQMARGSTPMLVPGAEPLTFRGTPRNLGLEAN